MSALRQPFHISFHPLLFNLVVEMILKWDFHNGFTWQYITCFIAAFIFFQERRSPHQQSYNLSNKHTVYLGMRRHPNRWPRIGPGRESRREEHTVTVRPGPLNLTAFCNTDPNHTVRLLSIPPTFKLQEWDRLRGLRKMQRKGSYFPECLGPNFRLQVKADPRTTSSRELFSGFSKEHRDGWYMADLVRSQYNWRPSANSCWAVIMSLSTP